MSMQQSSSSGSAEDFLPTQDIHNQTAAGTSVSGSERSRERSSPVSTSQSRSFPKSRPKYTIETHHLNINQRPDGHKQVNQYIMLETLGKGTFAKVKLAMDSESRVKYAVKIVDKALMKRKRVLGRSSVSDQLSNLRREIELMKMIDHENVVKLYEIIDDPEQDKIYLVMEHMVGGPVINLQDANCTPLPEALCKSYLRDILSGLEYLHSLRIAHRDIKPDNLLLSQDGIVKIADFGVSMQFVDSNDYIRATAGSLAFMAPELCLSEGAAYSAMKTDIWSAGISLFAMLFGQVPFTAASSLELYEIISRAKLEWPRAISPNLEATLGGMLEKDPSKRISLAQLKKDPWLTDNGAHLFGARNSRIDRHVATHGDDKDVDVSTRFRDSSSNHVLLTMRTNSVASNHPLVSEPGDPSTSSFVMDPIRRLFSWITTLLNQLLSRIRRRTATVRQE